MRRVGAVLALLLVAGCASHADATPRVSPDLMVVGDSISAHWRYDATGDDGRTKAWWAYVAEAAGLDPSDSTQVHVDAVPGTGMLATGPADRHAVRNLDREGEACGDNTPGDPDRSFGSRLGDISLTHPPRVLVVEGGRNDFKRCVHGVTQIASPRQSRAAIDSYLSALATRTRAAGISPHDVFVMTPWGTAFPSERNDLRAYVRRAVEAHHFAWIPTSVLPRADTVDGTHPDAVGTAALAREIETRSDVVARLRG